MAGMSLDAVPGPGLFEQAKKEYPILNNMGLNYKYNPGGGRGMLEFWPGDETGTSDYPRPKEFPLGSVGLEVYDPKTRPIDLLGDVVSHHMIHNDPRIGAYYTQFQESLTDEQRMRLQRQYQWAQQNEDEQRPYQDWETHSGLPAYFRGYPFQQWEDAAGFYTPDQLAMFDEMMAYLKGKKK